MLFDGTYPQFGIDPQAGALVAFGADAAGFAA